MRFQTHPGGCLILLLISHGGDCSNKCTAALSRWDARHPRCSMVGRGRVVLAPKRQTLGAEGVGWPLHAAPRPRTHPRPPPLILTPLPALI